jgi:hypothetical protein
MVAPSFRIWALKFRDCHGSGGLSVDVRSALRWLLRVFAQIRLSLITGLSRTFGRFGGMFVVHGLVAEIVAINRRSRIIPRLIGHCSLSLHRCAIWQPCQTDNSLVARAMPKDTRR